jgi:tetratricopeptide (TPR) repeat protein
MATDGLLVLACAALTAAPPVLPNPGQQPDAVASTLAVQTALQQGKQLLREGDAKSAVAVLEAQLPKIKGNRDYLLTLRDAYREYVRFLTQKGEKAELDKYRTRLGILDPDAAGDPVTGGTARAPVAQPTPSSAPAAPKKELIYRGKRADDPFALPNESKQAAPETNARQRSGKGGGKSSGHGEEDKLEVARKLLKQAQEEFRRRRFDRAHALFEQAHQADPKVTEPSREAWAYCKLHRVVEQLNDKPKDRRTLTDLEREVRVALEMSPRLDDTGKWLLREIESRQDGNGLQADQGKEVAVKVQHLSRNTQGWDVAETANFRILHHQDRSLVERAAQVAEQTRSAMSRKWFGVSGEDWNPKCQLYLHANGKEYSHITGQPVHYPGHSRIESDAGRVVARRIDIRCDNPGMLQAVLPHETTHVVLAGRFGKHEVPRWADEGMAVLAEPAEKVDQHCKKLAGFCQQRELFSVRDLVQMNDYPPARRIGAFYAQSVSLVDFLAKKRGPVVFSQFLGDALKEGYEPALRKHYHYSGFDNLQAGWSKSVFGAAEGYAVGLRGGYR